MYITKEADERKREILESATELFLEKGYKHTSVEDIAEKIGVVKGTCYHYFSNKEELYHQALKQQGEKYISSLNLILYDSNMSAKERLQRMLMSAESRFFSSAKGGNTANLNAYNSETIERLRLHCFRELAKGLEKCIQDGNQEGYFHVLNPQMCANAICHAIFGITCVHASIDEIVKGMHQYTAALLHISVADLKYGGELK